MNGKFPTFNRRQFIGQSACAGLGMTGMLSTIGTLRLFNAALSAQMLPPLDDGKVMICLFLFGGNDANNLLIPKDASSHQAYAHDRGTLALSREDVLSLQWAGDDGREFGFHPAMVPLQPMFSASSAASSGVFRPGRTTRR